MMETKSGSSNEGCFFASRRKAYDVKGLRGGAVCARRVHRGMDFEARRLRSRRFLDAFMVTYSALSI